MLDQEKSVTFFIYFEGDVQSEVRYWFDICFYKWFWCQDPL